MITQTAVLEDKYSAYLLKEYQKEWETVQYFLHTLSYIIEKEVCMVKVNFSLCLNTMPCRSMVWIKSTDTYILQLLCEGSGSATLSQLRTPGNWLNRKFSIWQPHGFQLNGHSFTVWAIPAQSLWHHCSS